MMRYSYWLAASFWLLGCSTKTTVAPGETDPASSSSSSGNGGGSSTGGSFECEAPDNLPADPLTLLDGYEPSTQKHLVDVQFDPATKRVYGTGVPGLVVLEADANGVNFLGQLQGGGMGKKGGKFEHVEVLNDTLVALTSRGRTNKNSNQVTGQGIYFVDVTQPSSLTQKSSLTIDGASGMAARDEHVFLLSHDGKLHVINYADPSAPSEVASIDGLSNPWDLVLVGDYAYVADTTLGLVTIDLSSPTAPSIVHTLAEAQGAQDVSTNGSELFVAAGLTGVHIVSLKQPASPALLTTHEMGGSVISVSVADGVLWTTDQERIAAVDITDPAAPVTLAVEKTPSWAMHVDATEGVAYIADWRSLSAYNLDKEALAPDADVSMSDLYFPTGTTERELSIHNRGGAELVLSAVGSDDPRVTVTLEKDVLAPGEKGTVTVQFEPDGKDLESTLCIASNDPDDPVQSIVLASTSSGSSVLVGQDAPNFLLTDLDGNHLELAKQLGKPVFLCYFATW